MDTESNTCLRVLEGHTGVICSMHFSTDSKRLVSFGRDGALRIWDINSGECLCTHDTGDLLDEAFVDQCNEYVYGLYYNEYAKTTQFRLWDCKSRQRVRTIKLPSPEYVWSFDTTGTTLYSTNEVNGEISATNIPQLLASIKQENAELLGGSLTGLLALYFSTVQHRVISEEQTAELTRSFPSIMQKYFM